MKICSACLEAPGKIRVVEREVELAEDEVLVKTHHASICLADVKMYSKGCYVDSTPLTFPVFLGHEAGGTVEAVGERVHEYRPGDKVSLMHDVRAGGLGPGGIADYFKVKPMDLIPVPEGLAMDLASLAETICPFVFVVLRSGVKLGDTAVVTGMGFIGQIIAQGLKKSGAAEVIVVDTSEYRLNLALSLGADIAINSSAQDAVTVVMDRTNGQGADLLCQAAAYTDATVEEYMNLATDLVKPTGIMAFQGDFLHPVTLKNIHRWHHEALDIRSIAFRHYHWQQYHLWARDCLKPIQRGMIQIRPLITSTYRLNDIASAFEEATNNPDQLKIVIEP